MAGGAQSDRADAAYARSIVLVTHYNTTSAAGSDSPAASHEHAQCPLPVGLNHPSHEND